MMPALTRNGAHSMAHMEDCKKRTGEVQCRWLLVVPAWYKYKTAKLYKGTADIQAP